MGESSIRETAFLEVEGERYRYHPVNKCGNVEKLPYSLTVLLENVLRCARTDEEAQALFDEACSSYQFPLGTPETVGKRATDDGTDYKFSVKSRGMDGKEATSTIYVTVEKGAKAEFTEVVR